ncbi:hypothetical protein [Metasolibacillus sp. FSL K6-0083]|uniref:hypothetical protein n=1 Tax=Metasolibacillus sp. FSL K6-0083 TaxID=2921416 RepID=UPI00315A71C9
MKEIAAILTINGNKVKTRLCKGKALLKKIGGVKMDERLKNLKRAMKKNIFADLHFNEEHRATIRDKMQTNVEKEFFTLLTERKTAMELI